MTEAAVPPAQQYAGLVTRTLALLIDALMIDLIALLAGAAVGLILSLFGDRGNPDAGTILAGGLAWLLWSGTYFVTFWVLTGQTPGSRLLGIRVIGEQRRLNVRIAARRFGGLVLATLPLGAGLLMVLFDERRRGFHDRLAGTVVRWERPDAEPVIASPALRPSTPHSA